LKRFFKKVVSYIVASVSYERSLEGLIVSGASVGEGNHQEWFVQRERNFRYIGQNRLVPSDW
jgi:hypothetical protein